MRQLIVGLFAALLVIAGIGAAVITLGPQAATALGCDEDGFRILLAAQDAAYSPGEITYRQQELEAWNRACGNNADTEETSPATPKPTTTSPPATSTPDSSNEDEGTTAAYVFYSTFDDKAGINNYGPQHAQDPALNGKALNDMTRDEAIQELKYRTRPGEHGDPMLTAGTGCDFDLWSCSPSTLAEKTLSFMSDSNTWQAAITDIDSKIDGQGSQVETLPKGSYVSTYALNGGGFPEVYSDEVYRTSDLEALVFDDGSILRLICGFQSYWTIAAPPEQRPQPMPEPSPGMTRDEEGQPQVEEPEEPTPSETSTPTSTATTTPTSTPTATTTPSSPPETGKCQTDEDKAKPECQTLAPGLESPTDNPAAPTAEPSPTHDGPVTTPSEEPTAEPSPTTSRTTPPNEAPDPTATATGGPTDCAVCGDD